MHDDVDRKWQER